MKDLKIDHNGKGICVSRGKSEVMKIEELRHSSQSPNPSPRFLISQI